MKRSYSAKLLTLLCAVLAAAFIISLISCTRIDSSGNPVTSKSSSSAATEGATTTTEKTEAPKLSADKMDEGQMLVEIMKIGKADCIIINENGYTVMIDTGEADDRQEIFSRIIRNGVDKIDCLIITHFHNDHVGAASEVINTYQIDKIIQPSMTPENPDADVYIAYTEAIKNTTAEVLTVDDEYSFTLGDMSFKITGSGKTYEKDNDNNSSLLTELTHAGNTFLFAGDVEKDRLEDMMEAGISQYDFLKYPHHGVYNKASYAFIDAVAPKHTVITCSDKNTSDFVIIERLQQYGDVYLSVNGMVYAVSDKNGITMYQ